MPPTIFNFHLEQIIARVEGRTVPLVDTCARYTEAGERCGAAAVEQLWPLHDIPTDLHCVPVCEEHLADHLDSHLLTAVPQ